MPRLHALELLPDSAGEDVVRRDWRSLRDAGLPSMLDHAGGTITPHLTVLSVPVIDAGLEQQAVDVLSPLLPAAVRTAGLVVLGPGDRVTIARLLDVGDDLVRAVLDLRASTTGHRHPGWLPHLTLVRRLPRTDLPRALEAVGSGQVEVSLTALRRWDPEAGSVTPLVRAAPG